MLDSGKQALTARKPDDGFAVALGLARFEQAGCVLESVERSDAGLRLNFQWAGIGAGTVSIAGNDGAPAFATTTRLAFRFVGSEVGRPFAILMSRMAIQARELTIEDLSALAGFDGGGSRPEGISQSAPVPFNPIIFWGPEDGWRQFVCDAAMERRFREAFEFDSDSSFIVHGDLECRFVAPGGRVRLPGHFVYPFDLFSHTEAVGPVTDLNDRDVILDPSLKIESRVLREVEAGTIKGPVIVLSTCVPMVIAEDPGPVLARLAPFCPAGISYVTPVSPISPTETFMESFRELRGRVLATEPAPGSIGLVGYRPGRARTELEGLLASAGLSVTGAIVPLITRRLLSDTLSAAGIVIAPSRYHDAMYDGLVQGASAAGRVVLRPEFPWGVSATARWLEQIAREFGRGDRAAGAVEAESAAARRRLADVCPADSVFLFVTDVDGLARLVEPLSPAGLPLIPLMCDLGLRSRVLVYCAQSGVGEAADRFREVTGRVPGSELVGFEAFHDEQGLSGLLTTPDAAAVYSEMFFDYRATRSGIPAFSSRIFEPGFGGAVRTAARFRRLACLPFYRRYMAGLAGPLSK